MKIFKVNIRLAFMLACFVMAMANLKAQVSAYAFSQSTGTYNAITGGTVINSSFAASVDNNVYSALPIGFTFNYNGVDYTDFGINANGWISLGAGIPVTSNTAISTGTTNNVIAAFNTDLIGRQHCVISMTIGSPILTVLNGTPSNLTIGAGVSGNSIPAGATIVSVTSTTITISANVTSTGTGRHLRIWDASLRYETVGVAPNRTLVVQWKNFARYSTSSGGGDQFNFQIILNETSNNVNVVYGFVSVGTLATGNTLQVGLKGNDATDFNNRSTLTDWSVTGAGTLNTATCKATNTIFPASGQTFSWIAPVPCSGTPTAGTTSSGSSTVCSGVNFALSLTGASTGLSGLSYQWQSSLDSLTYADIVGLTSATANVNQTAATYYQCIVTCSNGGATATSTPLLVNMSALINCYCSTGLTTTGSTTDIITNVVLTNSSGANLTQASTGSTPYFTSYNNTPLDLYKATFDTIAITFGTDGTQHSAVWIDWNQDGIFSATENIALSSISAGASATVTYNFSVPLTATLGNTRMRIRGGADAAYTAADACSGIAFGETEDYLVNIVCPSINAPVGTGASLCAGNAATLSATPVLTGSTLTWFDAASGGATVGTGISLTTPVLTATTPYWVEEAIAGCTASPRTQVDATVMPVNAALTPVDASCNAASDGSFTLGAITCGVIPFEYAVDGGAFGPIPTNFVAGTYSVIIRDAGMLLSAPISVVINQPTWTINNAIASNASVCINSTSALISAKSTLTSFLTGTQVVSFDLSTQPSELSGGSAFPAIALNPNIISTDTIAALPAGAIVTGVTFSFPSLTPTGASYGNDVGFGFTGAVNTGYASGTGAPNSTTAFSYTSTIINSAVSISGGTVNLNYYDLYADNTGSECAFPIGTGVATLTINYSYPAPATITWWDASTGGTQLGTGDSLETVGTSVLPAITTTGTYNFYAEGNNAGCTSSARTLVTVTVNSTATGSQTLTICAGDSVTVGINTHTATGAFTDVLQGGSVNGCDSTVTTNLTVLLPVTSAQTFTVCAGGSVIVNGNIHTTNGIYTDIITSGAANGCDSTVTTNLTVLSPVAGVQTLTVCAGGSVTVNGNIHATNGTFTDIILAGASNGCDSTVTTNLTVLSPVTGAQSFTVCAGGFVTVNGNTHTTSGTFTDIITSGAANGCDSTVTTNLTVLSPVTGAQTFTVCAGGSVTVNGNAHTTSGTFTDIITSGAANGCDSIVTTNLTVLTPVTGTQTLTVCAGGSVSVNGNTHTTTGTYTDVIVSGATNGCDSTVTTNLTVDGAIDVSTSVAGDVITSNAVTGTYQWIDCNNGNAIIATETNQSYTATASGDYAVIVTQAGACSDTSMCVNMLITGIASQLASQQIIISPNPTNGLFTLTINNANSNQVIITVMDLQGKIVYNETDKNISSQHNKQINLKDLSKGIYFVKLNIGSDVKIEKLIIQ